jgi:6-phosphogluconolactonase
MHSYRLAASILTASTICLGAAFPAPAQAPGSGKDLAGAVYVATNAPDGNEIAAFRRLANGDLDGSPSLFATGGIGSGTPLGNQGGLMLTEDERFLLAINARSDQVSVFWITATGLELRDVEPSGGMRPISIAIHDGVVYVLHAGGLAGGIDQVVGFTLDHDGNLSQLAGSARPLSAPSTMPAQVVFSPDGSQLLVTEKATNTITTYSVSSEGLLGAPHSQPSAGPTPFGMGFGVRDQLFVSEAFGGRMDASAVSSYIFGGSGRLEIASASVPTTETAACWIAVTPGGQFVYATNTGSDSVSGYDVSFEGRLELLDQNGVTAKTGDAPTDLDLSSNGQYLYVLGSMDGSISAFEVDLVSGKLKGIDMAAGLPVASNGLIAR